MNGERWLNDEEQRVWRGFIALSAGVKGKVDHLLKESSGLALSDYEVLVHLSESPDNRLRMRELSERTMHSRSRLSQRVDRMSRRGLVERERCEDDARGMWAVLTELGLATIEETAPQHVEHVREHFIDLIDPELLPVLQEAFRKIAIGSLGQDPLA
jgi:DNA-binding MarR family transcriptional regulator